MTKRQAFTLLPSCIHGVEAIVADSSIAFGRHTHDQFGIGLMDRGGHKSASGRGTVEAGPGDIITVNPGEVHDGAPIGPEGRSWRMLYFEPWIVAEASTEIGGEAHSHGEFASPVVRDRRVALHFRRLFAVATSVVGSPLQLDEVLLSMFEPLVRSGRPKRPGIPMAILSARSMMDDDPVVAVSLSDMAHEAGLSRYQFLRAFARLTGLTPHAYLVQRRVQLARQLLRRGLKPAEAATTCGFADQSHLTRSFVRTFGIPPGAYSKALS